MPIILAHGVLGPYDELIFLGVAVVFLSMMGVSWVRNRTTPPPQDEVIEAPSVILQQLTDDELPDRFPLD